MGHTTRNSIIAKTLGIVFFILLFPIFVLADTRTDIMFEARVVEILDSVENVLGDGTIAKQQNIKLIGLTEEYKGREIEFRGVGDYDVVKKNIYKVYDRVLVVASFNEVGIATYYISDYVRSNSLLYLFVLFVFVIILIGGLKGMRSIISLLVTFVVIVKYILPQILNGSNPLSVTLVGSFLILFSIIYITEGFKRRSHIAVVSILICLVLIVVISKIFIQFAYLTGLSGEDAISLISLGGNLVNFQGLLLAGVIIGALGVLDDVVISQIVTVEKLIETDSTQSKKTVFKKAYEVGTSHISSMTNTLFLAYAGASLPLLLFFVSGESAFSSWGQVVNNEQIATEIVRTLAGSIGLILAVPISTWIGVSWMHKK
jgi:uncharacterized membrane protein